MSQHGSYPNYKPVDAKWLGRVPVSWHVLMAKRVFSQMKIPRRKEDEQLSATQKYGVVPQRMFMEQEEQKVVLALSGIDNFKHVDKDDFVISLRSFQGGIERCHYAGCVSPAYTILKNRIPISHAYYAFLLKSNQFIAELQVATTGIRDGKTITYDQFGELRLPIPSLSEQAEIADHLDRETTRIDSLIEKKTRFIELLKEKRQAVITKAVTKGLDPSVAMKDSGLKSIGQIPAHWDLSPISRSLQLKKRLVGSKSANYKLLSLTTRGIIERDVSENFGKFPESFDTYQEVNSGDFVFCLFDIDETPRTVGLSQLHGMITGAYSVFETKEKDHIQYLLNLFTHIDDCKGLRPFYSGLRKTIRPPRFTSIRLPFPPKDEALNICSYIDRQNVKITAVIQKTERSIELLKEHRSALITAAVTGKIDVRISK